jgi:hypothetical protein
MKAGVAISIMLVGETVASQGYILKNKRTLWYNKSMILQWINQKVDNAADLLMENLRWLKGRGKSRGYYQMRTRAHNVAGTRGSHPLGAILVLVVVMAMEHLSHGKNLNLAVFDTDNTKYFIGAHGPWTSWHEQFSGNGRMKMD